MEKPKVPTLFLLIIFANDPAGKMPKVQAKIEMSIEDASLTIWDNRKRFPNIEFGGELYLLDTNLQKLAAIPLPQVKFEVPGPEIPAQQEESHK